MPKSKNKKSRVDFRPGELLEERYRVDTLLAQGGFSMVFSGWDLREEREVVIKVLVEAALYKDQAAYARFVRESAIAKELQHPNHVRVYAFGKTPREQPYLVMERLRGRLLAELFELEAPLPPRRVAKILKMILAALSELHEHGVVHRDLKPKNIFLIERDDEKDFVKLIDYGLAKVISPGHSLPLAKLTTKDVVVGTPGYLAPETFAGVMVTPQWDLYAVGLIGLELLCGDRAYQGTLMEKAIAQREGNPTIPDHVRNDDFYQEILRRLLKRDPGRRFRSAKQVLAGLESLDAFADQVLSLDPPKKKGLLQRLFGS